MRCGVRCSKEPWPTTSAPGCGHSSECALIERLYGVRFSEVQVWRLLGAMGFSSQKPDRRAIERDESAVLAWKRKTWPALKKRVPPSGD